jgi:hypothetical protein
MSYQNSKQNNVEYCNNSPLGFHVLCHASPRTNIEKNTMVVRQCLKNINSKNMYNYTLKNIVTERIQNRQLGMLTCKNHNHSI